MFERIKVNAKGRQLVAVVALLFVVLNVQYSIGQDKPRDKNPASAKLLSEFGIEASAEGIKAYLVSLVPAGDDRVEIANRLIEKLSAADYLVREQATKDLISLPGISVATLASLGDKLSSPEGKYRLKAIIVARTDRSRSQAQYTILNQIKSESLTGMASPIIAAFPYLEPDGFVRKACSAAIEASATAEDSELLRSVLGDEENPVVLRAGCLAAMSRIQPEEALDIANRLNGQSGELGLEVAKILVENNQRSSLDALLVLLDDKDPRIKFLSFNVIRKVTGLRFEGNYLDDPKSISDAKSKTKSWLSENAEMEIDFQWPKSIRLGRRLISHYDTSEVVELDESSEVVWSVKIKSPFCCIGLPNGHRMIVQYVDKKLIEYDASGKEVRKMELPSTTSGFCRKPNGEIWLAAGQGGGKIYKFSSEGKKLKEFDLGGTPTSVEVGLNGNLVCALYKDSRIVELDNEGKIVKSIAVKASAYHAQPLSSGNFLVSYPGEGRIIEYDPDGKVVWEHDCEKNSYRAQEFEDGSIVFTDSEGYHRINRAGETIEVQRLTAGSINYSFSY